MTIIVKHSKVSTIPDTDDTSLVRPSDWNADHVLTGTIPVANGGTGADNSTDALNNLLPTQIGQSGKYLSTDGTNPQWQTVPSAGGGSSVSYYFNGGVNQGTFGGNTYYQMNKVPVTATPANFTIAANGYIAQFITDANDPALLNIPAGNWNFEMYFSASSTGGSPSFYVELYKYNGTTFTLIASGSTSPEAITGGSVKDVYLSALAVPATTLAVTDRLAVRIYVTHSGRTITLYTQDNNLCQVTTTFSTGITALNGLTAQVQTFATGTTGTDFNISSATSTHTFNLPTASATNRGALSSADWTTFNDKANAFTYTNTYIPYGQGTTTPTQSANLTFDGTNLRAGAIQNTPIGATTPSTGKFSTLEATGTSTLGTSSSQYIQVEGGATAVLLSAQGAGTNIPLALQPKGTGAIQAQATTSTSAGGNARGANAVDWQTFRSSAVHVASGAYSVLGGGVSSLASGAVSGVFAGNGCQATNFNSAVLGGTVNIASGINSGVVTGNTNTASGYYGFVGTGFTNSTTSNSAVTTQSGTMNATTAVTLSGSNANIKVGQYITGTSIASDTYVAAISGTSLTLSKNASGSSTSTLSFFTPHGVVVGGGNNQATGSYSVICGGGDAGSSANRNVASGDWSAVVGGRGNTASGNGSFVGGGGYYNGLGAGAAGNTASGDGAFVGAGFSNSASSFGSSILGGNNNTANATYSVVLGSQNGIVRGIQGNTVSPASATPIGTPQGSAQSALLVLGVQTTDATATVLRSNSSAAGTTNQVILPNNSAYYFRGEIVAGVTGGGNTKGWFVEGVIKRGANAASTAIVGTATVTSNYADAGASTWAVTATADTTNGGLKITVTGQASTTIRWVARVTTTEMTF